MWPLLIACTGSLILGAILGWLVLRDARRRDAAAVERVEAEVGQTRAEVKAEEQSKGGNEVWKTFEELSDE